MILISVAKIMKNVGSNRHYFILNRHIPATCCKSQYFLGFQAYFVSLLLVSYTLKQTFFTIKTPYNEHKSVIFTLYH